MSDPTLRTAGDLVHILAFAVVGGVWLIGGAVIAVKLMRATLRDVAPMAPAGDRAAAG